MFIAFDIGNVLFRVNLTNFANKIRELDPDAKTDPDRFLYIIQASTDLGIMDMYQSLETYYQELTHEQLIILVDEWRKTIEINRDIVNWLKEFSKKHEVALLSNIGKEHAEQMYNVLDAIPLITHFSSEVGVRKPTKLYFSSFLQENPQWKNALFFDDRPENIKMATKAGLKGVQFSIINVEAGKELKALEKVLEENNVYFRLE